MDEERRRKIEAGKSKWAEFKKKRSRSAKATSPPNEVLSRVHEKSCPIDPGGASNIPKRTPVTSEGVSNEQCQSNTLPVSKIEIPSTESAVNKCVGSASSNTVPVMESSLHQEESKNQSSLSVNKLTTVPKSPILERNSPADILTLEKTDESETSSSSDNSTVIGDSSDSTKTVSTTENESTAKFYSISDKNTQKSPAVDDLTDNRPDEEKEMESIPTEEKEKDMLVEEIFVTKENFIEDSSVAFENQSLENDAEMESCEDKHVKPSLDVDDATESEESSAHLKDNVSLSSLTNFSEIENEPASFLNPEETELSSLFNHFTSYENQIKEYQEAIRKRNTVISELSSKLESTINASQAAQSAGNNDVERLKEEINFLQLKMKETADLLKKQKLKNGNSECDNRACQTESLEPGRFDTGVQVETSISSLLQSCNLDERSFFELFVKKFSPSSEMLHQMIHTLKELLLTHFSHVHIEELVALLKTDANLQSSFSQTVDSDLNESDLQNCEQLDTETILKKITSLNMVAKLIESLISISSGGANDTFSEFSPSKFQSFFLRRLHSMEAGDVLPDMSESESVVSDINYAEVETSTCKPEIESALSIEKLRRKNISEDFSLVTDFLQDEMDRICSFIPSISSGDRGEGLDSFDKGDGKDIIPCATESGNESDYQKILLHKSKLETRLRNLKTLDQELHHIQPLPHQTSVDSDTLTMSEDNIMMEESCVLSCVSLLSLTDSEYKGDNVTTDSEMNYSRKVSLDMTKSMQEREFCVRCEKNVDLLREKYENDIMNLKDQLEKSYSSQKHNLLESIKLLETEIVQLKTDKENLSLELKEKVDSLCSENTQTLKQLSEEYNNELSQMKASQSKIDSEKEELERKVRELQEKLTFSDKKIQNILDEKSKTEIDLQNQIADLIQEHEQDLEMMKRDNEEKLKLEKKHLENNYQTSYEVLIKTHKEEIDNLKKEFEEHEQNLLSEHTKTISMIEAAHCDESAVYQKKIEQLLEEKCELLSKTSQEYETILNKNHRALGILCKQLLAQIKMEKDRILNESAKSGADLDASLSAFEHLNNSLENGLMKFLNQNYFMNTSTEEFCPDETEYLPIEMNFPFGEKDMPPKSKRREFGDSDKKDDEKNGSTSNLESPFGPHASHSESSLDSDDIFTIHAELNRLQEEFQKDIAFYKGVNDQLHLEIKSLKKQNQELEDHKDNLEVQLQEKEKELAAKESLVSAMDAAAVKGGSQLSATDIRSWQVQAAQTNSRLLHVLSDLVKTFLDIEHDINTHLLEFGLVPSRSGTLMHHDDDTGQSVGSREDCTSLSLGECPNLELTEDGLDLTPRACDVFIPSANYEAELEDEDVVLGASRRLRVAVDHVLNLLSRALENQQNQDLKLLLKRNEELSHELQEESQGRDAVHMELVAAESTVRKLESEKQRLEDLNKDLKDDYEILKRELAKERSKLSHLEQEKECALDDIHTLKEQCELLASRLGDPEKKLLEENSRLSSEKQNVQKNLSKERQSFLDRLHQMEIALEELNAEKDDLVEKKCKEIRDLKAEMEAMEKQLQSNRKFIEQQALEREQEREEFMNKISKMEEFVKEKERIQSTESQMAREIESLEELLRARIEDHKNAMAKKDEVEKELRHSLDKIRDLREVIDELEKQLDLKSRIEKELRQKLSHINESISIQEKSSSLSDSGDSSKIIQANGESMEQLHNLKEQIASQSQELEMMSQSQTLLHELRGQIHFLEAKVEQRARQLESSFLSAASSPIQSGATSPSGSQDSESMQIPCEDGWEMSPRSIHWLEVRRLEEKIGRLAHIDEELLKKNKEIEVQLKKTKALYSECQHENTVLQEKLSEQLVEISALKSHIEEQKHRCSTPQKTHSFAEKIEELQENLEKQIENNKRLISDLQEAQSSVSTLQDEIHKKEEIIAVLQTCAENKTKQSASEDSEISTIEDLRNQVSEKRKLVLAAQKEMEELRSELEYLKTENTSLKSLLAKAEEEVEAERAQVETLCDEMANLAENSKEGEKSETLDNSTDKNETPSNEETQDLSSKIIYLENRLKDKNLQILMLKATVTKLESSMRVAEKQMEFEKVLVETLQQELGSLTSYQKRLEQDFNTVQDMMQQKERELATLHEETEAQMKLEAEIESLENKLSDQKNIESELREEIEELQKQLDIAESIKKDIENKDLYIKNLKDDHMKVLNRLKKQIAALKKIASVTEDETDIQEIISKIMGTIDAFRVNETDGLQEVLTNLLRNCIQSIVSNLEQKHEEHITSINKSWEEKIREEISSKDNFFKSETERLQKTFYSEKEKIKQEKDSFWQEKLDDVELKLKNVQMKCRNLLESAKATRTELQATYTDEITSLRQNLDSALKEKLSLENMLKVLGAEVERLKKAETEQKECFSKEYESKLSAISKTIQESFESEKEKIIASCQQKIDDAQKELNLKLDQEKKTEIKHKEELAAIHKYFETRWADEVKKLQEFQSEDLKKLRDNNEKILEDRIQTIREEQAALIAKEKMELIQKHDLELQQLQEKHEKEKKLLIERKEKEIKDTADMLEKKFNQNLADIQKNLASSSQSQIAEEQSQRKWEEEKLKLISTHRKQLSALKQELKKGFEKQLKAQAAAHSAEIKRLEETYNKQVEEVHDLIKEAKNAASKSKYSDSGSNRTTTPSSDMTSSDEACSSCQEDMLSANKHILVDKIHQDGKRVLSLIESSSQPFASVKDAHLWLDERKWIINRLKLVTPITSQSNLKTVINDLVEEVQKFRMNFETALEENSELKEKYDDLEQQLNIQYSKFCDVNALLKKQKVTNLELESLLSDKTSEIAELKRKLLEASRLAQISSGKETFPTNNGSVSSFHELEYLRSADEPKSSENFLSYLPEIGNTPSLEIRTPSDKVLHTQELPAMPEFYSPPMLSTQNNTPPGVNSGTTSRNDMFEVKEKLLAVLNNDIDTTDAKLHGLYWVCQRSQSYNKSLIYQKKYLLMLLRGFQGTEKVTMAWLNCMNADDSFSPESDRTITDSPLQWKSRFRAAVFVIIALQRMKFYVRRWRLLARVPSSRVINAEIQFVFQNYNFLSPAVSPGGYHLSNHSLSSAPLSFVGRDCKSSQMSTSSRTENKFKNSTSPDKSQLIQYVHRLEILQKQLGLDSLR